MYSFSYLEPVCCSMSSSNCCFLTCIQISQEAGQVVWYSHLFQNCPQFIVIHTVKGFGIVNKSRNRYFSGTLAFSMIQRMLAIWSLVPLPFLKPAWTSGSSWFMYCWSLVWRILSIIICCCCCLVAKLCLTLYDTLDCHLPGSSVCGILYLLLSFMYTCLLTF